MTDNTHTSEHHHHHHHHHGEGHHHDSPEHIARRQARKEAHRRARRKRRIKRYTKKSIVWFIMLICFGIMGYLFFTSIMPDMRVVEEEYQESE